MTNIAPFDHLGKALETVVLRLRRLGGVVKRIGKQSAALPELVVFRQVTGSTPTEFRRQSKPDEEPASQ